ncbi:hypothetical protein FQZ97_1248490 [compost metagenome]
MVCNVPRNNALARLDSVNPEAVGPWRAYVESWTRWNHVRMGTALAAAALMTVALCLMLTVD